MHGAARHPSRAFSGQRRHWRCRLHCDLRPRKRRHHLLGWRNAPSNSPPNVKMDPVKMSQISRRHILQVLSFLATNAVLGSGEGVQASDAGAHKNDSVEYGRNTLPPGVRSRRVDTNNGVVLHILEAGFETTRQALCDVAAWLSGTRVLLAQSVASLARAGFHVVAPDLRGYGRSAARAVSFR